MKITKKRTSQRAALAAARVEPLESRTLMYAASAFAWPSPDVSVSFAPDGTALNGGSTSALFAHLDAQHPTAIWQREFARALQTWAQYAPLNFHLVNDDGSPQGTSGSAQGDPRFGDIRLGAAPIGSLAIGFFPSPVITTGGDVTLSTNYPYAIGSVYDLYSVLLHESGHALGLEHSLDPMAVMSGSTAGRVVGDLSPDDVAGIQAVYGARQHDAFDALIRNDSFSSATPLNPDASGVIAAGADLTGLGDADYYAVTVPNGSDALTVSIDARGLSLLAPAVRVYDAAGNLVAAAGAGSAYGTVAAVSLGGLTAGQAYVIVADGASDDVFGSGAYRLNARFGLSTPEPQPPPPPAQPPPSQPTPPSVEPDRYESNDTPAGASDLGRTSGFTQTGLSLHSSADRDYYRFVPAKNGTYVMSAAAGQGMGVRLTLLDGAQRALASGPSVTFALTAGKVYYVDAADLAGACGGYDFSLVKANTGGGGGGRRGSLHAPPVAGDALYPVDSEQGAGHDEEHAHSEAWFILASLERPSALPEVLMEEVGQPGEPDADSARLDT